MITIIGAGLSGLLIGYRLKGLGIPFQILEARDRIGGRIYTVVNDRTAPLEMGATWIMDQHEHIHKLLGELKIHTFEQYMSGTSFFQPFSSSPAQAIVLPSQPPSFRIKTGTSILVQSLAQRIGHESILLNEKVKQISFSKDSIDIIASKTYTSSQVVLALPPKLWANTINFTPALPDQLLNTALNTHTWMEDSIKVALTYETSFWRRKGLSGTLFSNSGPITEFYDHSNAEEDQHALCGFLNPSCRTLNPEDRKKAILLQVSSVFGDEAKNFTNYNIVDWSDESLTHSENEFSLFPHQNNGSPIFQNSYFDSRLIISSTETAPAYPGYMEGAVISAEIAVEKIKVSNIV